jgi:hypothetical protein
MAVLAPHAPLKSCTAIFNQRRFITTPPFEGREQDSLRSISDDRNKERSLERGYIGSEIIWTGGGQIEGKLVPLGEVSAMLVHSKGLDDIYLFDL